jgi:excisionase family DNA binding protein
MEDEFLTVDEVAERLNVPEQSVRNMIDRRELRAVRVGVRWIRVRQGDLDAFLETPAKTAAERDAVPDDLTLRAELATALSDARARLESSDDAELAKALRAVARAASKLARALERSGRE